MWRHLTKLSHYGQLVPGICAPLFIKGTLFALVFLLLEQCVRQKYQALCMYFPTSSAFEDSRLLDCYAVLCGK